MEDDLVKVGCGCAIIAIALVVKLAVFGAVLAVGFAALRFLGWL